MLASRSLLAKRVASAFTYQPACLAHHGGDWGNWGNTNIAVVFSGCGWWDGTDVHEAAYTMYHLSRNGARFQIFAPNQQQMNVVDHMKSQPTGDNRNMMVEAARFSHGQGKMHMQDLSKLDVNNFDAVIFPGGHGITKNLSTFNKDGKDCKLHHDVERILKEFHQSHKPIGLASMAPLLACRVLPSLEVTMGYERDESSRWGRWPHTNMVQAIKSMGARHNTREPYISFLRVLQGTAAHLPLPISSIILNTLPHETYVDEKNKVITTPTFMWETDYHYHYIFDGIGNMVKHVMRMAAK